MSVSHLERTYDHVIFDYDWTIYLWNEALDRKIWDPVEEKQLAHLLKINSVPAEGTDAFRERFFQTGKDKGFYNSFTSLGGTSAEFESFVTQADVIGNLEFDNIVSTMITILSDHADICIYSGSPVEDIMKGLGKILGPRRSGLITKVWGKDSYTHFPNAKAMQKYDPELMRLMVKYFEIDPERTIYFDDQQRYLKPAKEQGITTVHVSQYNPINLEGENLIIPTIHYLPSILSVVRD